MAVTRQHGSLSERRRRRLRAEVLASAQQLIGEHGFSGLKMDELALRSGITKPTLYSVFADKQTLLLAVAMHALEFWQVLIETPFGDPSALGQLLHVLRSAANLPAQAGLLTALHWSPEVQDLVYAAPAVQATLAQIDAALLRLIALAVVQGEIAAEVEPRAVLLLLYATLGTLSRQPPGGLPVKPLPIEALLTAFERGVRAGSGAAAH